MFALPITPYDTFFWSSFHSTLSISMRRLLLLALPDNMKLFDRTSSSDSLKSGKSFTPSVESDKSSQNSKKRQADTSEAIKVVLLTLV